jgi:hypothetical protein
MMWHLANGPIMAEFVEEVAGSAGLAVIPSS